MTCYQEIACPACGSNLIMKSSRSAAGTQRYRCHKPECKTKTFMLNYRCKACEPGIKQQVAKRLAEVFHSEKERFFRKTCKTER